MQLRDIVLCGCAIVPLVSGRSLFDWISKKEEDNYQAPIAINYDDLCPQPRDPLPHIIGLSSETTLSRAAEIATLDVYVKAAAPTEDEAIKEANAAADRVLEYLNDISRDSPDTIIESFKRFDARVDSNYWDDEYDDFTDFDFDGIEVSDASPESVKDKGNKKAKARFSVRVNRPSAVADLKKDLTTKLPVRIETDTGKVTSFDVRVGRIRWSLTDSSKAELKKELRAKALREAVAEGQDYADIYELSGSLKPSECVEEYTWVGEKYDWTDDYRDDSVEPKEIEGSTTMKCKFNVGAVRVW